MSSQHKNKRKLLFIIVAFYLVFFVVITAETQMPWIFFVFGVPGVVGLSIWFAYLNSPKHKGIKGEKTVAKMLEKVARKKGGFVINDIIIPDSNFEGKTSQIDHIIITKDYIAAIETKNWAGFIFGKEEEREWTQVLANGNTKNHKYNPVKQNFTHVCRLVDLLELKHGIVDSYVCFPKADLSNVKSNNVYTLKGLRYELMNKKTDRFEKREIEWYRDMLLDFKNNPIQSNKEHIKEIHKMQNDVQNGICPRCGGKLVLRTNKSDGTTFLACSNYPKCKFIKKH